MADSETDPTVAEVIQAYADEFDALCIARHKKGQEEYGTFTFLGNDVVRMMLEELADTANYCRYQSIKLLMLQEHLENVTQGLAKDGEDQITIGVKAFKGVGQVGWEKT